jgi:hypothetical protein
LQPFILFNLLFCHDYRSVLEISISVKLKSESVKAGFDVALPGRWPVLIFGQISGIIIFNEN